MCRPHPIQSKKAIRPAGRSPLYTINNFICILYECQEIVTTGLPYPLDFEKGRGYYNNNFIPSKALKRTNGRICVRVSENAAPAMLALRCKRPARKIPLTTAERGGEPLPGPARYCRIRVARLTARNSGGTVEHFRRFIPYGTHCVRRNCGMERFSYFRAPSGVRACTFL